MKNSVGFLIFVAGAAIGSAATWYYTKEYYKKRNQEDIDSVKEKFSYKKETEGEKTDSDEDKAQKAADMAKEKPSVADYAKKLSQEGYTNYSNVETPKEESDVKSKVDEIPFVIPPEEFGEIEEYNKISLTYYADHILADDGDEIIENVEGTVGWDSLNHFGEYKDDSVFVRNHRLKVDYEILLDQRDYSDVIKRKPYLGGV